MPKKLCRLSFRWLSLVLITGLISVSNVSAGGQDEDELPEAFRATFRLYDEALGPFTRQISTSNGDAQAYFNQGFQMMYAFAKMEAAVLTGPSAVAAAAGEPAAKTEEDTPAKPEAEPALAGPRV